MTNRLADYQTTTIITHTYIDIAQPPDQRGQRAIHPDDNGNLLSDGVYTYAYNHANRLIGTQGPGTQVSYT